MNNSRILNLFRIAGNHEAMVRAADTPIEIVRSMSESNLYDIYFRYYWDTKCNEIEWIAFRKGFREGL